MAHAVFHVRRLLDKSRKLESAPRLLTKYELMPTLEGSSSLAALGEVVDRCRAFAEGRSQFVPGAEASRVEESQGGARLAANRARRQEFVERMREKARKDGFDDEDHYLRQGRDPPTPADLAHARSLLAGPDGGGESERAGKGGKGRGKGAGGKGRQGRGKHDTPSELTRWWRERFGQHCQGFHVRGECPHSNDPRGCGFLHGDDE